MTTGFAKSLFQNTYNRTPWKESKEKAINHWPKLQHLFLQKRCTYLDYTLTVRLLKNHPEVPFEVAILICHVIMAAREGHLCVRVEDDAIYPSIDQIWREEDKSLLSHTDSDMLYTYIKRGFECMPHIILNELCDGSTDIEFSTPLCRHRKTIYLQRHWIYETLFLKYFNELCAIPPSIELNVEKTQAHITKLYQEGYVLKEQAEAIKKACLHSLSIVTGGPGTGKTYTAGQMIKIIWNNLNEEQKQNFEIAVTAPTGKAVAHLQKNLNKVIAALDQSPKWIAGTLHSLLGIKSRSSNRELTRLTADLVIVDESSMIDMQLMSHLFEALKKGSRVIFLGDRHQLPSVEAGSVFADLIHLALDHRKHSIPITELKTCLRAELRAIVDFASLVNQGLSEKALEFLHNHENNGMNHLLLDLSKKASYQEFLQSLCKFFPSRVVEDISPEESLGLFQSVRILSPMRKGLFGSDELNALFWKHLSGTHDKTGWLAIPIMIVTNDYRKNLFNGETGTLMRKLPLKGLCVEDYAIFPSRQDEGIRKIPAHTLPKYEYAYCLSVHKSQGSEFDHVILVMPQGSEVFGREVFYTAVTRAKKRIEIYGSDSVICKTIDEKGTRFSGIIERMMR